MSGPGDPGDPWDWPGSGGRAPGGLPPRTTRDQPLGGPSRGDRDGPTLPAQHPPLAPPETSPPSPPSPGAPRTSRDEPAAPRTTHDKPSAPRTTRDEPGTPRTTRDEPGAPRTTVDGAAPRTRRDEPGAAPGQGPSPDLGTRAEPVTRVNLPRALADRYHLEGEAGDGGEADLLLAREYATGRQVVVKRYRRRDSGLPDDVLRSVQQVGREHTIELIDWGSDSEATWEILEYARFGSLASLQKQHPGPWPAAQVHEVVTQLTGALEQIHARRLVHRDIKPENLLVRERQPLDLVLSDFGLLRQIRQTKELRTRAATIAYAAPEGTTGVVAVAVDWWAVGIIAVELLTGLNPFQHDNGQWMSDMEIVAQLASYDIDLTAVTDFRWQLLCRGLLTRIPEQRWGAEQVRAWLRGNNPQVFRPAAGGTGAHTVPPQRRRASRGYVFEGTPYFDPRELATAMREQWSAAARVMAGQNLNTGEFTRLRDWLHDLGLTESAAILMRPNQPERLLAQLLLDLDPEPGPTFRGFRLDRTGLIDLVTSGDGLNAQSQILDAVLALDVLPEFAEHPGCEDYPLLHSRWRELVDTSRANYPSRHVPPVPQDDWRRAIGRLLATLLSPDTAGTRLLDEARRVAGDERAHAQQWFRQLAGTAVGEQHAAAQALVVTLSAPHAIDQTARMRAEEARREQEAADLAARRRREQQDQWMRRLCLPLGILSIVPGYFIFLGIILGPAAVATSVLSRRTQRASRSTNWAILLGLLGFVLFWVHIANL